MDETDWRIFLRQVALSRAYEKPYELAQHRFSHQEPLPGPKNPVLEEVLPSLLYVRLSSLLDEALASVIETRAISLEREDLYHRIEALADSLLDAAALHGIRKRRRDLAHESVSRCSWNELDEEIGTVQRHLEHLGLVGTRPSHEVVADWDLETIDPPFIERRGPAVVEIQSITTHTISLLEDGARVDGFEWREAMSVVRAPQPGE